MSKPEKTVIGTNGSGGAPPIESVADILDREQKPLIEDWLNRVEQEPDLTCIPLSFEERTGHLLQLLNDVIARLRLDTGTKAPISQAAGFHGDLRRKQGYTVAMVVSVAPDERAFQPLQHGNLRLLHVPCFISRSIQLR